MSPQLVERKWWQLESTTVKLIAGYALGSAALSYSIYAGHSVGSDHTQKVLNVLLCVAGGVFGWIAGVLITPGPGEHEDFSKVGGALMTFISGLFLGKIEPLLEAAVKNGSNQYDMTIRSLLFTVSFGVGALFVFVGRKYWRDPALTATNN